MCPDNRKLTVLPLYTIYSSIQLLLTQPEVDLVVSLAYMRKPPLWEKNMYGTAHHNKYPWSTNDNLGEEKYMELFCIKDKIPPNKKINANITDFALQLDKSFLSNEIYNMPLDYIWIGKKMQY